MLIKKNLIVFCNWIHISKIMVRIAVIGCGQMGTRIAGEMAYHGHRVKLYDSNRPALNAAPESIEADKSTLLTNCLIQSTNFIGQILCLSSLKDAVCDAEFIFEAITDDFKAKVDIFKEISKHCPATAVLASNTLTLDISKIAAETDCKERIIGLRFLFPVYMIDEVEIGTSEYTSPSTIEKVHSLMQRMRKTLFFRTGPEPFIFSEDQRDLRRLAVIQQHQSQSSGVMWLHKQSSHTQGSSNDQHRSESFDLGGVSSDKDCAICMDRSRDCLLCPCHHLVTCSDCAQALISRNDACPICRKDISSLIRVYHS